MCRDVSKNSGVHSSGGRSHGRYGEKSGRRCGGKSKDNRSSECSLSKGKFKRKIAFLVVILIFNSGILTGCWDKIEIDRKSMVSSIGVDTGKDIDKIKDLKDVKGDGAFSERAIKSKLKVTYGFPDISELGPGKSGTAKEKFITTDAYSMADSEIQVAGKSSRALDLNHSILLVLSENLLKNKEVVKEVVDYFQRQPKINMQMQLLVAKGDVETYMKYVPSMESNFSSYISGLMKNSANNATILPITVNEFLMLTKENGNAIIPTIEYSKDKNEMSLVGVAIIKEYELKGYMTPVEVSCLEILRGTVRGGNKVVYKDGHPIDFAMETIKRKIRVNVEKGKGADSLNFNIDVTIEGSIKGNYIDNKLSTAKNLGEIQDDLSKALSKECDVIAKITQKNFMVDPIGLDDYLMKFHPSMWKQVKGQWDKAYENATINTNVQVKIRRIGEAR